MRKFFVTMVFCACTVGLHAQAKSCPDADKQTAEDIAANLCHTERLELELVTVKLQGLYNDAQARQAVVLQQAKEAAAPMVAERQQMIAAIEKAHPGCMWHDGTGPNDQQSKLLCGKDLDAWKAAHAPQAAQPSYKPTPSKPAEPTPAPTPAK